MKKITLTLAALLTLSTILAGCTRGDPNAAHKKEVDQKIEEFNKTHGTVSVPYNYNGPNTNPAEGKDVAPL